VGGAVATIAYFQASGVATLTAAALYQPPQPRAPARAPGMLAERRHADAQPILERNPFDSETGPLDGSAPVDLPALEPQPSGPESPLEAPKCTFGAVSMTMLRNAPARSFAAILSAKGETELAWIGDTVLDHRLSRVAWDRVWFRKDGGDRCQMEIGDDDHMRTKRPAVRKPKKRRRRSTGIRLPKRIADKIERVGPNELRVDRSVVDEILENQARWMRFTRIRPFKRGDELVGLRLSRVRGGTLLHTLGMKNGDVLKSINGFEFTNPEKALQAYGKLRAADNLTVEIERRGKPVSIDIDIQ
jgi:general secretion pathway protein C